MAQRININRASQDELKTLPGVGDQLAEAIIRYREDHGGFDSCDEIDRVPGFAGVRSRRVRDEIDV